MSDNTLIARAAQSFPHQPYSAIDCSHFVYEVIKSVDPSFSYITSHDYLDSPRFRRVDHPEAGDIVHWPGHVAIIINPTTGAFIGSQSTNGVSEANYVSGHYWSKRPSRTYLRYQR